MSPAVTHPEPQAPPEIASHAQLILVAILLLLWFAAYLPILGPLAYQWTNDDDMGHGMFVPVFAGYLIWSKRDAFLALPSASVRNLCAGAAILSYGCLQVLLGILGSELYLQRSALILSLIGTVFYLKGSPGLRLLRFPLVLLFFMVPIPGVLYKQVTFPLQIFASMFAEQSLRLLGHAVYREGNILELAGMQLSVVEACSGLRSLFSLTFGAVMYAYLVEHRQWMRWLVVLATIPLAIIANSSRIVLTGLLGAYDRKLAEGAFHSFSGWLVFVVALTLMFLNHTFMSWITARVTSRRPTTPAKGSTP